MSNPTGAVSADAIVETEQPTPVLVCEADDVQVDLPPDDDPFSAALQVGGVHHTGTEVVLWLRLTPTSIGQLLDPLSQILQQQQSALGVPGADPTDEHVDAATQTDPDEGRIRRALDPLGIRHLRDRSPRSTVLLAAAIAALMLLAFLVQLVRG